MIDFSAPIPKTGRMRRHDWWIIASLVVTLPTATALAAKNVDVLTFAPADDGGRFISLHQSQTLKQWGFNVGATFDYAFRPLEFSDITGARRAGIIDDLVMANVGAAIGWTDWWQTGFNVPVAGWMTFFDPNTAAAAVQQQTFYGKLGDPRLDMKFRLLDSDRHGVGLALVPFVYFPLGKDQYFLGNGMWSPGGSLVLDFDIANRLFLTLNVGYRNYLRTRYDFNNADAIIDDTLSTGVGANVRVTDSWAIIGEAWHEGVMSGYFKNQLQNPAEFLAGVRLTPQTHARGLGITIGGGRGITTGVGSPEFRALLGLNYRRPERAAPPPPPVEVPVVVEEKIVITQKIHFEFAKANIRPASLPILDDVASLLNQNPQIRKIRVEGHTDWIGSDEHNKRLSQARANAVRDYLVAKGVEPDRLEAIGYGKSRPVADNHTDIGRARNRRTEFTVE